MCKWIAVTNRKQCNGDFFRQIQVLAEAGIRQIILREKDLSPQEYQVLAEKVLKICRSYETECILHSFIDVAENLNVDKIHLPLPVALKHWEQLKTFQKIGLSTHSMEQVRQAEALKRKVQDGTQGMKPEFYITLGHIFATDCKKDLPPRGLQFLQNVCRSTELPVYAIGGIHPDNAQSAIQAGAAGACLMSWCMNAAEHQVKYLIECGP